MVDNPNTGIAQEAKQRTKKPNWLRVKLPTGENYKNVRGLVDKYKLHTICESGHCPNMGECWGASNLGVDLVKILVIDESHVTLP